MAAAHIAASLPRTNCVGAQRTGFQDERKCARRRGPLLFAFTSRLSSVELRVRRVVVYAEPGPSEVAQTMPTPFMSSEEYDERAHELYNEGSYDEALGVLREGLALYPNSVELHVGVGYARLAR